MAIYQLDWRWCPHCPDRCPDIDRIRSSNASIDGITVGSRDHFQEMNAFLTEHDIHSVIERVFPFEQAGGTYDYLQSAKHFGKVVVDVFL